MLNEYTDVAPNEEITILLEDLAHPTNYRTLSREEIANYAALDGTPQDGAVEPKKATPAGQLVLVILDVAAIIVLGFVAVVIGISAERYNLVATAPMPEPAVIALDACAVGLFVVGGVCCVLSHMPMILHSEAPGLSEMEGSVLRLSAYGSAMLFAVVCAGGLGQQILAAFAHNFGMEPFPAWAEWLFGLVAGAIVIKLFVGRLMAKPCLATLAIATIVSPMLVVVAVSLISILLMAGLMLVVGILLVVGVVHTMHSM